MYKSKRSKHCEKCLEVVTFGSKFGLCLENFPGVKKIGKFLMLVLFNFPYFWRSRKLPDSYEMTGQNRKCNYRQEKKLVIKFLPPPSQVYYFLLMPLREMI